MSRADRAKEVLNNDEFKGAFRKLEDDLIKKLKTVGMNDTNTQKNITLSIQLLGRIEKHLISLINDDKVTDFNIKQKKRFF